MPSDPNFVVADLSESRPDEELRRLDAAWRAAPQSESAALMLASAYLERARRLDEPRFYGRAEAVLATVATRPGAGAKTRRLYAEVLQFRHDFAGAASLLDQLVRENPRDTGVRLNRAALRLTRGDFAGARADCAQLAASAGAFTAPGFACLAQSLAASGELRRARALLDTVPALPPDPAVRAYLLATRAELAERAGQPSRAVADYREALRLVPGDATVRAALADVLLDQGERAEAAAVLVVPKPNIALLARSAAVAVDKESLLARAREWIRLEAQRGDAGHHREAAMLALAADDPEAALAAASRNFEMQRELADVRVLARAAVLANDATTRRRLRDWLRATGFEDAVTERILAAERRS